MLHRNAKAACFNWIITVVCQSVRIRKVARRQASKPFLISLKVRRMLKRMSDLYKLLSIVHRMSVKLESEFLDSL